MLNDTTVTVTCYKPDTPTGWEAFTLTLVSEAVTDLDGCYDPETTYVDVTVQPKPDVKVLLDSSPNVCSDATESLSTWTVYNDLEDYLNVTLFVNDGTLSCVMKDAADTTIDNTSELTVAASAALCLLPCALASLMRRDSPGQVMCGKSLTCIEPLQLSKAGQGCILRRIPADGQVCTFASVCACVQSAADAANTVCTCHVQLNADQRGVTGSCLSWQGRSH